jgi:parallel beta-helix repeat protein
MKVALVGCSVLACLVLGANAAGAPEHLQVLVVDNGSVECPNAAYTSIQAAVDDASLGAIVRVCPGLYEEAISVTKTLTIRGLPDAVDSVDCFASTPHDLSPQKNAIVDPPDDNAVGFTLAANDIDLAGFVIQGGSIGVTTSDRSSTEAPLSGYRVHHNLIRQMREYALPSGAKTGGYSVDLATAGPTQSRVDHNCFRENTSVSLRDGWGLATVNGDVIDARIDHNSTYGLTAGIEIGGNGVHRRLTIDHNVSDSDIALIHMWRSEETRIVANESRFGRTRAIGIAGSNDGLEITGNWIHDGWRGIAFANRIFFLPGGGDPANGVTVRDNVIERMALDAILADSLFNSTGSVIGGNLNNSLISGNVITDNGGEGIILRVGNTGNTVSGNIVDRNKRNGIHAQGATGNDIVGNAMHGNGTLATNGVDARDSFLPGTSTLPNTWVANTCTTDVPVGAICRPG